jgi:glutamyl-tRNA synthetase
MDDKLGTHGAEDTPTRPRIKWDRLPEPRRTPSVASTSVTHRPARLRFAPSPTGYFHVGGARTALYNRVVADQLGGRFVLRIEDTDTERNRQEWTDGIQRAMRWIGADWDEGPYFQSEREHLYAAAADRLVENGNAYYCDCTREVVDARTKGHATPGYDGFCRDRGLSAAPGRALRFRTPREGHTTVVDIVRGTPTFENRLIEDFVVQRGNGSAMFLLANVVDDIDMGITHVLRAEEHLPNTPKAILLWQALDGGELPAFAHLPVLVNEQRQKLSKRRDKVALEDFRDEGFLAEAMRNYLMLLGWSPSGNREIVPWEVMQTEFRLEDCVPSPAFFDVKKLRAFNGEYLRALPVAEFVARCEPWLTAPGVPWPLDRFDAAAFEVMAPLVQERVTVLSEVPAMVDFLFLDEPPMDETAWEKAMKAPAAALLDDTLAAYEQCTWTAEPLKEALTVVGEAHGLKLGKAQAPVRVAVTGRTVGPPLFESLAVLGRSRTLDRLRVARGRL